MKSYNLLLVTEDKFVIKLINDLSKEHKVSQNSNIKELNYQSNFDAILIAFDQLETLLKEVPNFGKLKTPLIYLFRSDCPKSSIKIQDCIYDSLNIDKLTKAGFERALLSITDKFHTFIELNNQINQLKALTQSFSNHQGDDNLVHLTNIKDLICENKQLIDQVEQQNIILKELASNDMLTKIPNRRNFEETLTRLLAHAQRHDHTVALLYIDLDKFKPVNDTFGHHIGDLLLKSVSERLQKCLRKGDFVARLGGDEFAVILHEIKNTHAAGVVAWKILHDLKRPYILEGNTIEIGASIGISCYPMIGETFDDLVKSADIAMYKAKKSTGLKYAYATASLQTHHIRQFNIENELKHAIKNNELSMVYQPIYSIPSKQLHGFESLVRWNNKKLGLVPPDQFIPIAEESGLIHPIGEWIFNTVCKQASKWVKDNLFTYKMAINLSPVQLAQKELFEIISNTIDKTNLPYNIFEFEITEMAVMEHGNNKTIDKLHTLGTSHALDDFGTGFSSISHLKYLPITTIKVDKTFIQGIGVEQSDNDIVSSLIQLGKHMGLKIVAEGVETEEQLNLLIQEGCDFVQGYYFSKPLSPDEAEKLMQQLNKKIELKK